MQVRDELRSTMLSSSLKVPIVLPGFAFTTSATARLPRLCEDWTVYVKMDCVVR
jgi:hypothetical protein